MVITPENCTQYCVGLTPDILDVIDPIIALLDYMCLIMFTILIGGFIVTVIFMHFGKNL